MSDPTQASSLAEDEAAAHSPDSLPESERTKALRDKPWKAERAVLKRDWKVSADGRRAAIPPEQRRRYWLWWLVRGAFYVVVTMAGFLYMLLPIAIKAMLFSGDASLPAGIWSIELWGILGMVFGNTLLAYQLYKLQESLKEGLSQRP